VTKPSNTLVELWIGNGVFALVALAAGIWFPENKIAYVLGVLLGALISMYLGYHMERSIQRALSAEGGAERVMRFSTLVRYGMVLLVIIISVYVSFLNPIGIFIGVMGLKVAAYLQPFTHKIMSRFRKEEEDIEAK